MNATAKSGAECRPGIGTRGFGMNSQQAFFDVRVFDPTEVHCFVKNENENKRNHNNLIMNVDNVSFTPLVFSIHEGRG